MISTNRNSQKLRCKSTFQTQVRKSSSHKLADLIYEVLARKDHVSLTEKAHIMLDKGIYPWKEKKHLIPSLRAYAAQHPDTQAEIFLKMMVNKIYAVEDTKKLSYEEIEETVKQAMIIDDDYITANVYWYNGVIHKISDDTEKALVYYYAASELFRELSTPKFNQTEYINFDIAILLYYMNDFRRSIEYSLKSYASSSDERSLFKRYSKIYLLDILGAAYRKYGMADSSIFYYTELLNELNENTDFYPDRDIELWSSISYGNIGENYFNQGKFEEATPLINMYYNESIRLHDTLNILLSRNVYAQLIATKGKKGIAIKLWRSILNFPAKKENLALLKTVCDNLTQAYRSKDDIDSAFYFHELQDKYQSRIDERLYISGLNGIKQEFAFSELSKNVLYLEDRINHLKRSRLYAIAIILLSSTIVLLIFHLRRKRLRQELLNQKYKRTIIEKELTMARERTATIKNSLLERNNLASTLIKRIRGLEHSQDASALITEIKEYTLTTDEGWMHFKTMFLKTHPHFLSNLNNKFPDLSPAERRLSLLLYLKLNNSEIASLLGISPSSVSKSKYRLKRALHMSSPEELDTFIASL